ncbi:hypothetical protein [Cellulomonas sp. S1-8]|uniref:hypothetical protein n=1 Tax=Cellulomonas sp. S1-8 TaxID=2904790 RepID=UPI002243BE93|nr:hypothetical protein [Cellulomonas sp. S1-8]UZN02591.1 hypothetical protein OKX07_16265 [Cellulomonas sp. S1-8]
MPVHRPTPTSRLAVRVARWSATHPARAIVGWFTLVVVCAALTVLVPTQEIEDADHEIGGSGRAAAWVAEAGLTEADHELVLLAPAGDGGAADLDAGARGVVAALAGEPGVARVDEPVRAPDGSAVLVSVELEAGVDDVTDLQRAVADVAEQHPGSPSTRPGTSRSTTRSTSASARTSSPPRWSRCR